MRIHPELQALPRHHRPAVLTAAEHWLRVDRFTDGLERLDDRFIVAMPGTSPWLGHLRTVLITGHETTAATIAYVLERITHTPRMLLELERTVREGDPSYPKRQEEAGSGWSRRAVLGSPRSGRENGESRASNRLRSRR